jgi:hypothetical protein
MADAPRARRHRPLAIALLALAALLVACVGAALWNPSRYTMLFPLSHQGGGIGVLVLAGALVAVSALLTFSDSGRKAVFGLTACLVAVPAFCVGLPAVTLPFRPRPMARAVMVTSPEGDFVLVKAIYDTPDGQRTRLFVRSRQLLFSRESAMPVAECGFDPFERGMPPESVRFTSETTVAVPVEGESTVVVRFDPDSLTPDRTVAMCGPAS